MRRIDREADSQPKIEGPPVCSNTGEQEQAVEEDNDAPLTEGKQIGRVKRRDGRQRHQESR